jgi:hypothetical protein
MLSSIGVTFTSEPSEETEKKEGRSVLIGDSSSRVKVCVSEGSGSTRSGTNIVRLSPTEISLGEMVELKIGGLFGGVVTVKVHVAYWVSKVSVAVTLIV